MAKNHVWYVCPACRSRLAVERHHAGEIRCRNCSVLLRAAKESASASAKQSNTAARAGDEDDEYRLAPLGDERPAAKAQRSAAETPPQVDNSELKHLRARRERIAQTETAEGAEPVAGAPGLVTLDELKIRDDERYKPEPPPRWTFFSGVFTYPWRPQSMLPWVILSIGIGLCGISGMLILAGLFSGSQGGTLMAGFLGLGWIWMTILTGGYAAACVFAVTETTAYNFDAPYDWPEPDWRERFFHFLWLGWCFGLAVALVITPASLGTESLQYRLLIIAVSTAFLFPIFMLSTLETNSLFPLSAPVWRSLLREAAAWIAFYVLSGAVVGGCGMASIELYRRLGMLSVVVLAPMWAACVLIYARLLGRLAWRIMRPEELQLQAWRKAHQSTLAAEVRQRLREEEDPFEE
ncbi:MAG: hypothetical protein WD894_20025 [Pirellulales bacterium]